jgi:hypothetical protein
MLLPTEEAAHFHSLYHSLLGFVCARIGGVDGIVDGETFRQATTKHRGQARDLLYDNIDSINAYIEENPDDFRELDLGIVLGWKRFLRGRFLVERDLRSYTVFLAQEDPPRAYGVLGLTTEILDIIPQPLPALVHAVLLPWKGRIVCDGLLGSYNVMFGPGVRRGTREAYKIAKAAGIITSLDPDWQPPSPTTRKKPKTPAIRRFIKRCPKTVKELEGRFGVPRADLRGEDISELRLWQIDAKPVGECDRVLVYPNLIAKHDLYVFARGEEIMHLTAPPRLQWSKSDLRPPEGWRHLR